MVDHDEYLIKKSDFIIELGPKGGKEGGQLLASFSPEKAAQFSSIAPTAKLLSYKEDKIKLRKKISASKENNEVEKLTSYSLKTYERRLSSKNKKLTVRLKKEMVYIKKRLKFIKDVLNIDFSNQDDINMTSLLNEMVSRAIINNSLLYKL